MGLESVQGIWDLNAANPAPGDNKSEGDDHLRNLKKALKATFPNVNKPITVNADRLNGDYVPKNSAYQQLQAGQNPMLEWHVPGKTAMIGYLQNDGRFIFAISNGNGGWVQSLYSITGAWFDIHTNLNVMGGTIYSSHLRLTSPGAVSFTMAIPGRNDRIVHRNVDAMGFLGLDGNWNFYSHDNGDIWSRGNIVGFSDERVKRDWKMIPEDTIDRFAEVQLCGTYTNMETGARMAGISAQKLQAILPEAVTGDEETLLGVAYGNAAMVLVHKLAQRVIDLERRLEEAGL